MPCNSDYLQANGLEIELSRVYQLLDELEGKNIDKKAWDGYDNRAYCRANKETLDTKVSELCVKLQSINVKNCSLEMQLWWRNHQEADANRKENERLRKEMEEKTERDELARLKAKYEPKGE